MTLSKISNDLSINKQIKYLVVFSDGKIYDQLIKLKAERKDELKWLLPFIGDWHTLNQRTNGPVNAHLISWPTLVKHKTYKT